MRALFLLEITTKITKSTEATQIFERGANYVRKLFLMLLDPISGGHKKNPSLYRPPSPHRIMIAEAIEICWRRLPNPDATHWKKLHTNVQVADITPKSFVDLFAWFLN